MNNLIYVMKKHNTKKVLCFFLATEIAEKCKKYGGGGNGKCVKMAEKCAENVRSIDRRRLLLYNRNAFKLWNLLNNGHRTERV